MRARKWGEKIRKRIRLTTQNNKENICRIAEDLTENPDTQISADSEHKFIFSRIAELSPIQILLLLAYQSIYVQSLFAILALADYKQIDSNTSTKHFSME